MRGFKGVVALAAVATAQTTIGGTGELCFAGPNNTFTTILDPFASATGYYKFEECGDVVQPTLAMERGVTYTFKQYDASNWYHPLGFAYSADGAHRGVDELEPGIGGDCAADNTCQAPMYYLDGVYVGGSYDNVAGAGGEDFGLDAYEPDFFLPRGDWQEKGLYEVRLTLTDDDFTGKDFFYFCHIHNRMSGRVKIVDASGTPENSADTPDLGYEYQVPSEFDAKCGTYGTDVFQQGSGACMDTFVCVDGDETQELTDFAECLYAVDCAMDYGMRTDLHEDDAGVTFMHQMIPHHENAVNMAKLLLKVWGDGVALETDEDADVYNMLWDIINTQNHQINVMEAWLDSKSHPRNEICCSCPSASRRNLLFAYSDAPCVCP